MLPLLQYVVDNGNTTVYEWSYGEPPLSVEPDPVHIELDDEDQGAGDQVLKGSCDIVWSFFSFGKLFNVGVKQMCDLLGKSASICVAKVFGYQINVLCFLN